MILDEEVFAVILAVSIIASTLGIALVLRPGNIEPFTAIGLLNENCKIGEYPEKAFNESNLRLCIYVENQLGYTGYFKVVYKIASNTSLPTNTTPSPTPIVKEWRFVLASNESIETSVEVPVYCPSPPCRMALVFELWEYNIEEKTWMYTGRWVHLYINITSW